MPTVELVVPWRGGCPYRERAWSWCKPRYGWPVTMAEGPPGPWCKAAAAMPAISRSSADVVVLADADISTDGLGAAVAAVEAGAPWAIPHKGVHRLSAEGTAAVLAGEAWEDQPLEQRAYRGVEGGGYVVAARETLLDIPLDPRFTGWGQEDVALALALRCLAGVPWRGKAPLVHLYHPPQERATRRWGTVEGRALYRRYLRAKTDPAPMRNLIQEARDAGSADKPAVHAASGHRSHHHRRSRQRDQGGGGRGHGL